MNDKKTIYFNAIKKFSLQGPAAGPVQYMLKVLLLALAFYLTGRLGLYLAVPPGFATIIWPPSGIALGALILYGRSLWPGIIIGSFLLNAGISDAFTLHNGNLPVEKLLIALTIASGSALQAVIAHTLIVRVVGLPLKLSKPSEIIALLALAGPIGCLIACSVGVTALYAGGIVSAEEYLQNWLTWWAGDMFGVIVFCPLLLIAPRVPNRLEWRGEKLGQLPTVALLILIIPLALTLSSWKAATHFIYEKNQAGFELLAQESEKALTSRLHSYEQVLYGGVGFFEGSEFVSRKEWRAYVHAIDIHNRYPGINGIGWIADVKDSELPEFLAHVRADGAPDFMPKPEGNHPANFIITYIEPENINREAIGLNIAFEQNRYHATTRARDTGKPAITKRILLVQDDTKSPGFLLLTPMYKEDMPMNTAEERQQAFSGWIYAPFVGKNFMSDLTNSQGVSINISVYDGEEIESNLIYASADKADPAHSAKYTLRKDLEIYQQPWTITWESTPAFEHATATQEPALILVGGLIFTALFGILLMMISRRTETVQRLVDQKTLQLRQTEDRYQRLVEGVNDYAIYWLDTKGFIESWNSGAQRITGYKAKEIIGEHFSRFYPTAGEENEEHNSPQQILEIAANTGKYEVEGLRVRKDGSTFWAQETIEALKDPAENLVGFAKVTHDITAQKKFEEELQLKTLEAQQAAAAKADFLAKMSHEIRTPMNGILGFVDILGETQLEEYQKKCLEKIDIAGNTLIRVINDILDLSKIEAGKMVLEKKPFNLRNMLSLSVDFFARDASEKDISFQFEYPDDCPKVFVGDQYRLQQIVLNLLSNAAKFTDKGYIRMEVTYNEGNITLIITDSGIGISEEAQKHIFESFIQEEAGMTRKFGGSGLGLTITRELIEAMEGTIHLKSTRGRGSTFTITIPMEEGAIRKSEDTNSALTQAEKYTILLVEDIPMNQEITTAMLERFGHRSETCVNGQDALERLREKKFDLVLMDIQMPVMDGIEATKRLRSDLHITSEKMPVIALTAHALPEQIESFFSAGMDDYILKPVKANALQEKIMAVMQANASKNAAHRV